MLLIAIYLTAVFMTYMLLTDRLVGTSSSISASYYAWKKKNYSSAFIIFLTCIAIGLMLITSIYTPKHEVAFNLLLLGGGFSCYCIGIAANFKQGWRESLYHNVFSVITFASVHAAFYVEGIKFPLLSFALLSVVFLLIDVPKKTTIIETVGIGLAIMGVYSL